MSQFILNHRKLDKELFLDFLAVIINLLRNSGFSFFRFLYRITNKFNRATVHIASFRVLSHDRYQSEFVSGFFTLLHTDRVGYSSNLIYNEGNDEQKLLSFPMEDVKLYHYKGLTINGSSDLIIDDKNNVVINDLCYNKENRIKYHDSIKLAQHHNTIIVRYNKQTVELASGIVISGIFPNNYYHALFDNLIRIMVFDETLIPVEVPFLIDKATYEIPSLRSAFEYLTEKRQRPFTVLDYRTPYHIKDMYYISHVNHLIPSIISYDMCKPTDILFDLNLTLKMREVFLSKKSQKLFPEKIFISRKQTTRRNFNEDEVFAVLQEKGFERVFPENLSFEEQIALFNNAKVIVGAGGAAMTNLIFCKKGCKVLIIYKTKNQVPCFTTVPYSVGVTIRHYGLDNNDKRLHSDFVVNPYDVINALNYLYLEK